MTTTTYRSNKSKGTKWEKELCAFLSLRGFWATPLAPKADGTQPFDVVAGRNGVIYAFECKTVDNGRFSLNRLENNQKTAYKVYKHCGNTNYHIAFKCSEEEVYFVELSKLLNITEQKTLTVDEIRRLSVDI